MVESLKGFPKEAENFDLNDIASDALQCIEKVAECAETALRSNPGGKPNSFASINTLTGTTQVNNLRAISESDRAALQDLIGQPVIARVEFVDEAGKVETIFITRTTPQPVAGYTIASYRSPLGSIATRVAGEDLLVHMKGVNRDVEIINTAKLKPKKTENGWDSRNSEVDLGESGKFTVVSLRALLAPIENVISGDAWDEWEQNDKNDNILDGVRRAVLLHMGLRDQPILDRHQDEIFRLPLNTHCFLSGPPGTGKTTTLIRRLGQKIDLNDEEVLTPAEKVLIEKVSQETGKNHRSSWAMFSPTELLRQYVKEGFAREGFAASDHHIHTWEHFRDTIARDNLRLLRTSTGGGAFYKNNSMEHLNLPDITKSASKWFDDFDSYFRNNLYNDLTNDAKWLEKQDDAELSKLGKKLVKMLNAVGPNRFLSILLSDLLELKKDIQKYLERGKSKTQKIILGTLNRVVHEDSEFPAALKKEIERQISIANLEGLDETDDPDTEIDALEYEDSNFTKGHLVSREQVKQRYTQAVSAQARAKAGRRKLSDKSFNGQLLAWLGEGRIPGDDDLRALGDIVATQSRLRRFDSFNSLVFRSIAPKYRKFRLQRCADELWYKQAPSRPSNICWQELDLLVLFTLRVAGDILAQYRKIPGNDLPKSGIIGAVNLLYKNQILVDEATDFSVIQLASMYELSHPLIRSFFMCGDLNQRITQWGVKSYEEIDWIARDIQRRKITVSYRQSGHLVSLARAVAILGGAEPDEIVLPDMLDIEGLAPVWKTGLLSDRDRADWLSDRIREIETIVGKVPTIAVLVNNENEVEPLAQILNKRLQQINISAVACKDGKVVGNDQDVRVFNIEHIKGLEFEAVFFMGLDKTIEVHKDLFVKYLYVGSTRAATYLGVSFNGPLPDRLNSLREHFQDNWA